MSMPTEAKVIGGNGRRDAQFGKRWIPSVVSALLMLGVSLASRPAAATFHLMKIVEIFPGTDSQPAAQYIMLQMYSAMEMENHVAGHFIEVFDASGASVGTFTFSQNVANGTFGSTILIATPEAATLFNLNADLEMSTASASSATPTPGIPRPGPYVMVMDSAAASGQLIQAAGGAVCYDVIDCVAWGDFSGSSALPTQPETIASGLTMGEAMHRDITDDSGDTTEFALAAPAPMNNAGQTGHLTQTPGANPTPTVTPGQTGNTPAPTATHPGATAPSTSSMGGSGGGGCAIVSVSQGSWAGALLAFVPILAFRRSAKHGKVV